MTIDGKYQPNITCPFCRFRHPALISCADAKRIAEISAAEREVTIEFGESDPVSIFLTNWIEELAEIERPTPFELFLIEELNDKLSSV